MKKNYYLGFSWLMLWAFVLFGEKAQAQVSSYLFNESTATYTPITGGTVYGTTTTDDQRFVDPAVPAGGRDPGGVPGVCARAREGERPVSSKSAKRRGVLCAVR